MSEKRSHHHSFKGHIAAELIESYGFEPEFFHSNPLTFDTMTAIADTGDPLEPWAFAYYYTGDRTHLPVEEWFGDLPPVLERRVSAEEVVLLGTTALSEIGVHVAA